MGLVRLPHLTQIVLGLLYHSVGTDLTAPPGGGWSHRDSALIKKSQFHSHSCSRFETALGGFWRWGLKTKVAAFTQSPNGFFLIPPDSPAVQHLTVEFTPAQVLLQRVGMTEQVVLLSQIRTGPALPAPVGTYMWLLAAARFPPCVRRQPRVPRFCSFQHAARCGASSHSSGWMYGGGVGREKVAPVRLLHHVLTAPGSGNETNTTGLLRASDGEVDGQRGGGGSVRRCGRRRRRAGTCPRSFKWRKQVEDQRDKFPPLPTADALRVRSLPSEAADRTVPLTQPEGGGRC